MMTFLMALVLFQETQKITYAAGYIPNIQFAPFYVAMERGYYREAGIDLTMDYTVGPDVLKLVALGKVHFASADPDALLRANVQGMGLRHLATLYQTYPIALISREAILDRKGLRGKRIGISGPFGSSYLGFKALLIQLNLSLEDVQLKSIGFTQVQALEHGAVDAVVGYVNHEPIRLQRDGMPVHTLTLRGSHHIPGVGIMTRDALAQQQPDLVQAFLTATFRGVKDVVDDPQAAVDMVASNYLTEINTETGRQSELAVLLATIPLLTNEYTEQYGYGQCQEDRWDQLIELLQSVDQGQSLQWRPHVDRSFVYRGL